MADEKGTSVGQIYLDLNVKSHVSEDIAEIQHSAVKPAQNVGETLGKAVSEAFGRAVNSTEINFQTLDKYGIIEI